MKQAALAVRMALGLGAVLAATAAHATTITQWNFENDSIATNPNPAPSTGAGTASSIGMNLGSGTNAPDVLQGASSDTGANGVANLTQIWRVRATGSGNGWTSTAGIGTQGAQFAASTVGYSGAITVSFDWYATTQGEANLQLEYTDNGTTWINAPLSLSGSDTGLAVLTNNGSDTNTVTGSYVSDNLKKNGSLAGQDWFTDLTATIADPNAANDPNFAIRLVNASTGTDDVSTQGTALNNTSGNWRFDNVTISGTSVPLPASAWLMISGIGGLGFLTVRRRGKHA